MPLVVIASKIVVAMIAATMKIVSIVVKPTMTVFTRWIGGLMGYGWW